MTGTGAGRRYVDGRPRVLVVADDERRERLAERVEGTVDGFAVETAATFDDAVAALDETVAIVVTTGTVPGGSAADLARQVTERDPPPGVVVFAERVDDELAGATAAGPVTLQPVSGPDPATWPVADPVQTCGDASLRRFERALESDALHTLFEGSEAAFFLTDEEGRYLRVGPWENGPDPEDALGETERAVPRRVDLSETWHEATLAVAESGDADHGRVTTAGTDDQLAFETTRLPWFDDDGSVRGVVGYRRRVGDERARTERLARRVDRLEGFVDHISHDLRNPLLVADGYLDLARAGEDGALDRVADALTRMEELVDDVEALAESDEANVALERTDFHSVVTDVWDVTGEPTDGATLALDVPEGTIVDAPEGELRLLFENCFVNAVDHAGPDVTVRVGTFDGGFYVADDGPGIPPEHREDVTERGFTTAEDGTGIGLAVVAGVADSNDWELRITDSRSTRGGADATDRGPGARFEFRDVMSVTEPHRTATPGETLALTDSADVGDVEVPGESTYDASVDRWTVSGEGVNVYHDQIGFHYVYTTVEGDVRIEGTVTGVEDLYPFSKGGFMIRDSLDPDAPHGYVGRIASGESEVLWGTEHGEHTRSQQFDAGGEQFDCFRLDREGSLVTCWVRRGGSWLPVDQRRVALDDPVHVGLAVCSVTPGESCAVTFEDVTVCRLETGPDQERPP
jgi:two-component system aerobic respiration control sensor histidine kinase ArcB